MKTYEEMIEWAASDSEVRFTELAAGMSIAFAYSVELNIVMRDISATKSVHDLVIRYKHRKEACNVKKASRLKNIVSKEEQGV